MLNFQVHSQNAPGLSGTNCDTCCCEPLAARAGETSPVVLDYSAWSVPISSMGRGLGCSPQFNIEPLVTCPTPTGDNPLIINSPVAFAFAPSEPTPALEDTVQTFVVPATGVLFELLPFYGPFRGKVVLAADGSFVYTPNDAAWAGIDRFFVKASVDGQEQVFEVLIGLNVAQPNTDDLTPDIKVINPIVNQKGHFIRFAVAVSPAARPCATYRLQVRMDAYDCHGTCFWNNSCYDISIGQCR